MASKITKAGKKEILDAAFKTGEIDWYGVLHTKDGNADPADADRLEAAPQRIQAANWETESAGTNPTVRPSADVAFTAVAADVGDVPRKLAFWNGNDPASATLMAWIDIYATGSTRLAAVAEADQGIVVDHDAVVLTLS
ncbi:MAG: hypothetical protein OXH70_17750 [Acidobacteria bacterium]|nr:hypothetical protein [Acidobacteriota bacterium]